MAFTMNHPAVTSTIIGPRTIEQLESQLPAADLELTAEILDRIDEVVAPGTTFATDDLPFTPKALRETLVDVVDALAPSA
ncbi:hypothetical protein GCM10023197_17290 [Gordonia humi]|uniref:Diketogulonate reductase-like aldo/keto reductase n=1 Tax=Gordonia humi TaxID=686429 RepID=A0A840ETZ6_9ACTN|nr:diketogulonate reductase-like aldo/keto reductase [Gordonia humi]